MEKEELSLKEKVDLLFSEVENNPKKVKNLKLPRKAKVGKRKIKKGWVGILKIDENGNISGEKQQIEDSTYKLKSGTYHALEGQEILKWNGKFPVVIQSVKKLNPSNFLSEVNETYGQKYVMARMLKDAIKIKNKGGNFIVWIIIIIVGFIAFNYFKSKGFFG